MNALIIFIKNATRGKVKTRIAKTVGDDKALEIYQRLLNYTREFAMKIPVSRRLYYSDNIEKDAWEEDYFDKKVQHGEDLGARMQHAIKESLRHHHKAILIGSDCSQLTPAIILKAFDYLNKYDIVIGPSTDGGYYLIGMKACHNELFNNIQWSTEKVLKETMTKAEKLSLKVRTLQTLTDIDHYEDWERYGLT